MLLFPPELFASVLGSMMLDFLSVTYGGVSSATLRCECWWCAGLGASSGMKSPWMSRYLREAVRKSSLLS